MTFEEALQAAIDAAPNSRVAAELIAIRDRLSGASAAKALGDL